MKVGKPVRELPPDIKRRPVGSSPYEHIYQEALSLNGAFLPVTFGTAKEARIFQSIFTTASGRPKALGLSCSIRGTTAYVYKRDKGA